MNFADELIIWYKQNKRNLPWRETSDPYRIWLSEIILQQTRVDQGLKYYYKFVTNYPTIQDLADAKEDDVLKDWQGLGYYSRARNLHAAAKYVCNELDGIFPNTYKDIIQLKGVGDYTASAIASFSFNECHPVVDGNVYRVLSRVFLITDPIDSTSGKKKFKELAQELISKEEPATYNQAIMEFGATHCTPSNPNCVACIFNDNCLAHLKNKVNELPFKSKKTKTRNRFFNYLVFKDKSNKTFIEKRQGKDIWEGLYQFPLFESEKIIHNPSQLALKKHFGIADYTIKEKRIPKHILSHQIIHTQFWEITIDELPPANSLLEINSKDLHRYAVPRLVDKYLEKHSGFFN